MITIRNINLDELIALLESIRKETNTVDMEVNEDTKEIIFIPKHNYTESHPEDISEKIKKMKEEYEKEKNNLPVTPLLNDTKKNLTDINKLA